MAKWYALNLRTMFGIELSPPAKALLQEVEQSFGKPVLEHIERNWEPSHYGESSVAEDGSPTVTINAHTGKTEATIVHELFHLKLRASGFPVLAFEFPPGRNTRENRHYVRWIGFHLRDPIQHSIFYSEMRSLGVDPDAELKSEFERALQNDDFLGLHPATKDHALSLYYLKAVLQLKDPEMHKRIERWYKRKGWRRSLSVGKKLVEVVIGENPTNPKQEIASFALP